MTRNISKIEGVPGVRTRARRGSWVLALLPIGLGVASFTPACGSSFTSPCQENRTCKPPKNDQGDAGSDSGGSPSDTNGGSAPSGGSPVEAGGTGAGVPSTPADGGAAGAPTLASDGGAANDAGSGGEAGGGGTEPPDPTDVTPPTVVSVSPANNAKGIAANATITVTWSEAMDKASAQAAFQSAELAGKVTFDWPSESVMKVTPSEPLVYAKGKHADLATLAAKIYSSSLNTSAKDFAGNALAKSFAWKFSTLRQLEWSTVEKSSYQLSSTGTVKSADSDVGVWVGDDDANAWYRLAVVFDVSPVPAGAIGVASATVSLPMTPIASWTNTSLGAPFATLGKIVLDHIQTPIIDANTLLLPSLGLVGDVATTSTAGTKLVDATVAIADDLKNRLQRANRSQFRAQFTKNTDTDSASDAVFFGYDSPLGLSIDYLLP